MARENQKKSNSLPVNIALIPEAAALTAVREIQYRASPIDILDLYRQIQKEEQEIENGDLRQIEKYLYSQAIALNAVFDHMLGQLAHAEFSQQVQLSAALALKAQAQCRVTLATLAEIKYPARTTFIQQSIRQQNNAINQQVNNASKNGITQHTENLANELLEAPHGKRLDSITTSPTIQINTKLEAMAQINGANDN